MTNKRLYEIMDRLGMIEDESEKRCCAEGEPHTTPAEDFENITSKDLVSVMNFVDELTLYNDLETIKKLLVAVIMENVAAESISSPSSYYDNCQADMGNKITLDIGDLNKPIPTKDILTKDGDK